MSLFKQIEIFVSLLLITILSTILSIIFIDMQEFAKNQLYTDAKNTANTLSLSLGAMTEDTALMQTTINAMFDGGYFEEMSLIRDHGTEIYHRTERLKVEGIPTAFIKFVDLNPPVAEATISDGWTIFGTLKIKGHPGQLYIKLWNNFKKLCLSFSGIGIIALIFTHITLKIMLRPLFAIKKQANAIDDNEFIINNDIPRTSETRQVVIAMNNMVKKVQNIYNREIETLNQYQNLKYKDSLTGLYNRKYFTQQLSNFIDSDDEKSIGQVMIIFLEDIETVGSSIGPQKIESFYEKLANIITGVSAQSPESIAVFLNRSEFALILPACEDAPSKEITTSLYQHIETEIASNSAFAGKISTAIGIASYSCQDDLTTILSRVDYALSVARTLPHQKINHFKEDKTQAVMGKQEWKNRIEKALANEDFILTAQSVLSQDTELHKEVLICMQDENGQRHRAGFFMPMVISLNLSPNLDKYVFEKAADYLRKSEDGTLALNITSEFLKDRSSFIWFRQFLVSIKKESKRLIFEIPDNTVIQHTEICKDFAGLITGMGFTFGVDNFIMSNESLAYLQKLKPRYIKISQEYLLDADNKTEAALQSLLTITDSLNIKLIATKIENTQQRIALEEKEITYFQGRAVAEIVSLDLTDE